MAWVEIKPINKDIKKVYLRFTEEICSSFACYRIKNVRNNIYMLNRINGLRGNRKDILLLYASKDHINEVGEYIDSNGEPFKRNIKMIFLDKKVNSNYIDEYYDEAILIKPYGDTENSKRIYQGIYNVYYKSGLYNIDVGDLSFTNQTSNIPNLERIMFLLSKYFMIVV